MQLLQNHFHKDSYKTIMITVVYTDAYTGPGGGKVLSTVASH